MVAVTAGSDAALDSTKQCSTSLSDSRRRGGASECARPGVLYFCTTALVAARSRPGLRVLIGGGSGEAQG